MIVEAKHEARSLPPSAKAPLPSEAADEEPEGHEHTSVRKTTVKRRLMWS